MSDLLKNIDARTKLAGTNKLEILLFFLGTDQRTGRRETFGINVFKVREVMRTPPCLLYTSLESGCSDSGCQYAENGRAGIS